MPCSLSLWATAYTQDSFSVESASEEAKTNMNENPILLRGTEIAGSVFGDARLAKRGQPSTMRYAESNR